MRTWTAKVRVGNVVEETQVQARTITAAKRLLEGQYGRGKVFAVQQVRG
jgi:hypothetical protein